MKLLLVANAAKSNMIEPLSINLGAQLENSIQVGWDIDDIIVVTNIPNLRYEDRIIEAVDLNEHCLTGSKMFGLAQIIGYQTETIWAHDLDCWQTVPIEEPLFADVGLCNYSRPKFNGGSVFWRPWASDIVLKIIEIIEYEKSPKEEPILSRVLKLPEFQNRVTVLNSTWNVGCSGFKDRFSGAERPVKVCHFHPCNRIAWDTHVRDRNRLGSSPVPERLRNLLVKWFPCIQSHT